MVSRLLAVLAFSAVVFSQEFSPIRARGTVLMTAGSSNEQGTVEVVVSKNSYLERVEAGELSETIRIKAHKCQEVRDSETTKCSVEWSLSAEMPYFPSIYLSKLRARQSLESESKENVLRVRDLAEKDPELRAMSEKLFHTVPREGDISSATFVRRTTSTPEDPLAIALEYSDYRETKWGRLPHRVGVKRNGSEWKTIIFTSFEEVTDEN